MTSRANADEAAAVAAAEVNTDMTHHANSAQMAFFCLRYMKQIHGMTIHTPQSRGMATTGTQDSIIWQYDGTLPDEMLNNLEKGLYLVSLGDQRRNLIYITDAEIYLFEPNLYETGKVEDFPFIEHFTAVCVERGLEQNVVTVRNTIAHEAKDIAFIKAFMPTYETMSMSASICFVLLNCMMTGFPCPEDILIFRDMFYGLVRELNLAPDEMEKVYTAQGQLDFQELAP